MDNSLQDNPKEFIPQLFEAALPASAARRLSEGYKTNPENRQISHIKAKWYSGNMTGDDGECNEETRF